MGINWPVKRAGSLDDKDTSREVTAVASSGNDSAVVVMGSASLFDEHGNIKLIPMPSANPKDPLNIPEWRKWTAVGAMCFFGSIALSAEVVIGKLIPIFLLEYAGLNPNIIRDIDFVAASGGQGGTHLNPLAVIPKGVTPPPLKSVAMLSTIPLLTNGIASYALVPLSIAVGRRPVLLATAVLAWAGGLWAGASTSLQSHIAARAVMGLGAGAFEALIPLIVQDMVFVHQRNKAQATVTASQGVIIIGMGILAPWVSANYTWRYLYFGTSALAMVAWLMLIVLLPETRWTRSKEMLAGIPEEELPPGASRPELNEALYGARTRWTNMGIFHFGFEWKNAAFSMLDTFKTTLFPAVLWSVVCESVFLMASHGAQQLSPFALLAAGWQYQWTGLSVIPFVLGATGTFFVAGPLAERVNRAVTRRRGVREAEFQLLNLLLPFAMGIAGCFIFGYAGETAGVHWAVLLLGLFMVQFGLLCVMVIIKVFIVESYPQWAGPVLVNVSSMRIIIGFFLTSWNTTWVQEMGLLTTFTYYATALIGVFVLMPLLFWGGKRVRAYTSGRIKSGLHRGIRGGV